VKTRTRKQVESAQRRAVLAAENLLQDYDRADEIAAMTPDEYAESKGFLISNPKHPKVKKENYHMATLKELRQNLKEKDEYIGELEDRLAEISGIATIDEDDEDEDDEEGEDSEENGAASMMFFKYSQLSDTDKEALGPLIRALYREIEERLLKQKR